MSTRQKSFTPVEVLQNLIGEITPVGDCNIDEKRTANLEVMIATIDTLLSDIARVAKEADRKEASVRTMGYIAKNYLEELRASLQDVLLD